MSKDNKDKKEGTFLSARERLNKLKEKKEKVQKLNLSEFINIIFFMCFNFIRRFPLTI